MIDFIGDVHGEADLLFNLLIKLGYKRRRGAMFHPTRKAVLLGDIIDRGPNVRDTLHLAKEMVDAGSAIILLGNHELNALQFHSCHPITEQPLREHSEKHIRQHAATLRSFNNLDNELHQWLDWIAGFPFFITQSNMRAAHAFWDEEAIKAIEKFPKPLNKAILTRIADPKTYEHKFSRLIVAGPSLPCSDQNSLKAKVYWWNDKNVVFTDDKLSPSSHSAYMGCRPQLSPLYPENMPPLFIGHYRMALQTPIVPQMANLACLDYNAGAGGPLVAYRWSGEQKLIPANFIISQP
ncbi:metallophosphoesterase [Prosthecobacter sp.]|uniref:metallophosphoesterase n=1 Tax=Prosthecobacter sp. TaxID=1965333 RepID=UPI0037835211